MVNQELEDFFLRDKTDRVLGLLAAIETLIALHQLSPEKHIPEREIINIIMTLTQACREATKEIRPPDPPEI